MSIHESHTPAWGSYLSGAIGAVEDATVVAPVNVPEPQENLSPILTKEEMGAIHETISAYAGLPGIQGAIAQLITAHAQDQHQLTAVMRELMQQIEAVQQDPHREIVGVRPEIAAILRDVRDAEKAKPDPLNAFRATPEEKMPPPQEPDIVRVDYTPSPNISLALLGALPPPNVPNVLGMQVARDDVGGRFA